MPEYYPESHKDGLALFDPEHNCTLLCGMKRYNFPGNEKYTIGVFGLSGSGNKKQQGNLLFFNEIREIKN